MRVQMKKTVVVLGKGALAIKIAKWFLKSSEYKLLLVVPVVPEPTWTNSFIKWAKENSVRYVSSGNYIDTPKYLKGNLSIDLACSVFYDKIIKEWFIKKCKKITNIHNGPLPKYRGVSSINWALKNKEIMHGVTMHEITSGIDDGPIISQLTYSIYPDFDEVQDVYKRAVVYGWALFEQTMFILHKIKANPQDDKKAFYYSKKQDVLLKDRRSFTRNSSQ